MSTSVCGLVGTPGQGHLKKGQWQQLQEMVWIPPLTTAKERKDKSSFVFLRCVLALKMVSFKKKKIKKISSIKRRKKLLISVCLEVMF